jgi:hypothetical protein
VSATRLEAQIAAADIEVPGTADATVFNPAPGGGVSSAATFTIIAPNPVPVLESGMFTPNSDGTVTLVLSGSGFISGTTVQWNGVDRPAILVNGTRLTISLSASDLLETPSVITVTNPGPGGGISNDLIFSLWKVSLPLISR